MARHLDAIRDEGLRPGSDVGHSYGISRFGAGGIWVANEVDQAAFYACDAANRRGDGDIAVVLSFDLPPDVAVVNEQLPKDVRVTPGQLLLLTRGGVWRPLLLTRTPSRSVLGCKNYELR